jgi:triacylglycerol esterase/lipase EstA (alpha/beta hydrolase family)
LQSEGFEAYAATVSPTGSVWDRACELYAHLTGTRPDYGAAHAAKAGHTRFGALVRPRLGADWPASPIHLLGHSFGGATVRLFAELCEHGSAEERAATPPGELSPLFSGALKGKIRSITTLAAPHNGTTAMHPEANCFGVNVLEFILYSAAVLDAKIEKLEDFWHYQLEHFGIEKGLTFRETLERISAYDKSSDSAKHDLSVEGASAVNRSITCLPEVYYFSYACDATKELDLPTADRIKEKITGTRAVRFVSGLPGQIAAFWKATGDTQATPPADAPTETNPTGANEVPVQKKSHSLRYPMPNITLSIAETCARMAAFARPEECTPDGIPLDERWQPNDGLVNTISAKAPFTEPQKDFDPAHIEKGIWQVMPVCSGWDHTDIVGGNRVGGVKEIHAFYRGIAERLCTMDSE